MCSGYPCSNCYMISVAESIDTVLTEMISEGLPMEDITVVVNPASTEEFWILKHWWVKIYPKIPILEREQVTGMDLPIVIALHHGTKYIQLMEMWSRACSRLIIVSPDFSDTQILSKAVDKGVLK